MVLCVVIYLEKIFFQKFGVHKSFLWAIEIPCSVTCRQHIPQIYLWCNTFWPLGRQHGNRTFSSTCLNTCIGEARVPNQECCYLTACDKHVMLYRMRRPDLAHLPQNFAYLALQIFPTFKCPKIY